MQNLYFMTTTTPITASRLIDSADLREQYRVYIDRKHAAKHLANLVRNEYCGHTTVLGISASGAPIAMALAQTMGLPFELAMTSEMTLPWDNEAAYGAVAFDGSLYINELTVAHCQLPQAEIDKAVRRAHDRVQQWLACAPQNPGSDSAVLGLDNIDDSTPRQIMIVDDGIHTGASVRAVIDALRAQGVERIVVAVPTGYRSALLELAGTVDKLYCPNVRSNCPFTVADAYQQWELCDEQQLLQNLHDYRMRLVSKPMPALAG